MGIVAWPPFFQLCCTWLQEVRHCPCQTFACRLFKPPEDDPIDLVDVEAEARLLAPPQGGTVQLDAGRLAEKFLKQCFRHIIAVNQSILVCVDGQEVVLRITTTNTLAAAEQEEAIGYHCYRGRLNPDTAVYLSVFSPATNPLPTARQPQQQQQQPRAPDLTATRPPQDYPPAVQPRTWVTISRMMMMT